MARFSALVRIGPRVYEILSVVFVSGGINVITGALDWKDQIPFGAGLTISGAFLFLAASKFAYFREVAVAMKQDIPDQPLDELMVRVAHDYGAKRLRLDVIYVLLAALVLTVSIFSSATRWKPTTVEATPIDKLRHEVQALTTLTRSLKAELSQLSDESRRREQEAKMRVEAKFAKPQRRKTTRLRPSPSQ